MDSPSDLDNSTEINDNKTDSTNNLSELITKIYARGFTQDTHSPVIQLESNAPSGGYYTAKVRVCTANNNKICSGKINEPSRKIKIQLMPLTKILWPTKILWQNTDPFIYPITFSGRLTRG